MIRQILGGILLGSACQTSTITPVPGDERVSLTTEFSSYSRGAEVLLRLSNHTAGDVGYNLCVSQLQRLEGAAWVPSQPGMNHVCTMELRIVQPGAVASYRLRLPMALDAGQYRFTTTVEHMGSGERPVVASNGFSVR